jgi:glycerol-3-phosphate dehydrogenase
MSFSDLKNEYDIIVIGGGITGAGVFYEAVQSGWKPLLLEARDFAWGTSSRSSKMVHGGLRYLKQGKLLLTKEAVKQRELLLKTYPGLVTPLKFIMPVFGHYGPSMIAMKTGLTIYSFMAGEKQHEIYSKAQTIEKIPGIRRENLVSAVGFKDAQVDDARLVLRLIHRGKLLGGKALNYTKVEGIKRDQKGDIAGVDITDEETGRAFEIKTRVVINATGAFAEQLHPRPGKGLHIRPLRGSHLIFPGKKFPLKQVISFIHPQDSRPVFLFPWEGCIVLGTTDVDHDQYIKAVPFVTMDEADYLMEGLKYILPNVNLSLKECISSFAGVRPVLSRKNKSASKESREHVVWKDKGLITVTGGKLTTFQLLAKDALKAAKPYLPRPVDMNMEPKPEKQNYSELWKVSKDIQERLTGRYGISGCQKIRNYDEKFFLPIETTKTLWTEIVYAAEHENICHLSDLLLRRVRIGLLLPQGGTDILERVESLCKPYLSWDNKRWYKEKKDYIKLWKSFYTPPII